MAEFFKPYMGLNALNTLRRNIEALLVARRESQTELAFSLGHDKSWLNKFLNGSREIQFKDLDRIADFFGIATYQLFAPGISRLTERRSAFQRRSGQDRRVGHAFRGMVDTRQALERAQGAPRADPSRSSAEIETVIRRAKQFLRDASAVVERYDTESARPAPRADADAPADRKSDQVRRRGRAAE